MPLVTHHVIDPSGGDPVGVRALVVRLVTAVEDVPVFRRSDGAEVRLDETVTLADKGQPAPTSWELDLPSAASLTPDTRISIRQVLDGDSTTLRRTPFVITVPSGPGPYRLVDLLEGGPPVPEQEPLDPLVFYDRDQVDALLVGHVIALEPHPVYDDLPSLTTLFENRLV